MEQIEALPEHIRRTLTSYLIPDDERQGPLPVQEIADAEGVTRQAIHWRIRFAERVLNHPIERRRKPRDKDAA